MASSPDDELPDLFLRATKRIRRNQMTRLAPLGLTPSQARALRTIGRAPEPLRMSALAEHLGIVPRSATSLVDALVAADLVVRTPDPTSRRATLVTLSDSGQEALNRMSEARREATAEIFAALTADQRETLRTLLQALGTAEG
ncbi:MarR family winged helix-turn-helix transcriptional regulator [Nocardia jejuensis]|uniref:MarR family winged helix-turn-helix transcriptional regulator n=1 Tax=Nocardia jejuensis TaxID=328049 RepID=UPI00082EC776|nr:MarR family transcriptional regulator [Nocardia jejuensis]